MYNPDPSSRLLGQSDVVKFVPTDRNPHRFLHFPVKDGKWSFDITSTRGKSTSLTARLFVRCPPATTRILVTSMTVNYEVVRAILAKEGISEGALNELCSSAAFDTARPSQMLEKFVQLWKFTEADSSTPFDALFDLDFFQATAWLALSFVNAQNKLIAAIEEVTNE